MDIAKIRKKSLAKAAGKDAGESAPGSVPTEDEKDGAEIAPVAVEGRGPDQEVMPAEEIPVIGSEPPEVFSDEDVPEEETEVLVELLTFSLSHEEYAFRVSEVEEILRLQLITKVPTMADYILGITSLRGKIIPVIDLKTRLNLQEKSLGECRPGDSTETKTKKIGEKKILIIEGPKGLIGATIDRVIGVVRLPLSEMLQPPGHLDEHEMKFIEGIVVLDKRFISIINSGATMDIETS